MDETLTVLFNNYTKPIPGGRPSVCYELMPTMAAWFHAEHCQSTLTAKGCKSNGASPAPHCFCAECDNTNGMWDVYGDGRCHKANKNADGSLVAVPADWALFSSGTSTWSAFTCTCDVDTIWFTGIEVYHYGYPDQDGNRDGVFSWKSKSVGASEWKYFVQPRMQGDDRVFDSEEEPKKIAYERCCADQKVSLGR